MKYYIIEYSTFFNKYLLEEVVLLSETDTGEEWYFTLKNMSGDKFNKCIEEIYGIGDLEYLKEKVNKLNSAKQY